MTGSGLLEIAIGLFLVFMTLSSISSALNEWLGALTEARGRFLASAIRTLLNSSQGAAEGVDTKLFQHPLIKGLSMPGRLGRLFPSTNLPSYIPPSFFSAALLDVLSPASAAGVQTTLADLRTAINDLPPGDTKRLLTVLASDATADLDGFKKNVESWYADAMERVSGWYKKHTQLSITLISVFVAVSLNADIFMIAKILGNNPAIRTSLVNSANAAVQPTSSPPTVGTGVPVDTAAAALARVIAANESLGTLPIALGWSTTGNADDPRRLPENQAEWLMKILGLLVGTVATSMGAPFYFDLLKILVNIRMTGTPPDERTKR